jgi:nucleotide-binding universal stress UspA family protein
MKKMLVPTDFSNNSKHALTTAARLATQLKAKLYVMHANVEAAYVPPLAEYAGAVNFDMMDYSAVAAEQLFAVKNELLANADYAGLQVETLVEEGYLHTAIERVAKAEDIDLIVMGTKGATGATEFFVGSNTEKVIRTAICPVLSVPEGSDDITNIKLVAMPSTLKEDQAIVFAELAKWQKVFNFDVKVIYLNNPAGFKDEADIELAAEKFAAAAHLKNVSTFVSSNTFNEEAAILQFAEANNADLIAMGTHQRKGLSHMIFGSLTEDTVNHSAVPVLSIPL